MSGEIREFHGIRFNNKAVITAARIEQFQRFLGQSLPTDYAEFLKDTNGQGLQGSYFVAVPGQQVVKFHTFLGLDTVKNLDLEHWHTELQDALPLGCLNIGRDPGGNLFLLSLAEDSGTVSYYDRAEAFPDSSEQSGNTYVVAPSFTDFIQRMRTSIELATRDLQPDKASVEGEDKGFADRPPIAAPAGKNLSDRLMNLQKSFPAGSFESLKQAVHSGFELSTSLDDWNHRNEQFLNERIDKYIVEDPELNRVIQSNPQTKLLYGLLWGYVLGQLATGDCTMQEYANAKATIRKLIPT